MRPFILSMLLLWALALSAAGQTAGRMRLDPPWTGKIPAREVHPCLFFGPEDIPALKERIAREPYQAWFARLNEDLPDQAFAWLLTGDARQAAAARDHLLNDPIYREKRHQYIEPSSHYFFCWIVAYDCLASWPGLSAGDHRKIREKLANEAKFYYQAMTEIKGGQNYGNQRTLGASALGMCALTLSGYTGSAHTPQQWLDMALGAIKCPENFWFWRPDGMFVEGYGYTNYMGLLLAPFMSAYTRLTGEDLFRDPTLAAWMRYQTWFLLPDGRHINFGTSNYGEERFGILFPLFTGPVAGKEYSGLYAWGARFAFGKNLHSNHLVPAIALFDDRVRPEPERYPPSAVFPECEQMVMKDGWSEHLTGIWITGKGAGWAPKFYSTYSHADPTSFVIFSGGEFLAVDAGYTHWHGPDCSGPESHNLVLIDGKGPASTTLGELRDAVTSDRAVAATVETAYADYRVNRVFLFGEKRVLIVADFLKGKGEHDFLFQLHSAVTVGKAPVTLGERDAVWPGFGVNESTVSPTTLHTFFAGPVTVERIPSHWRPTDDTPVDNIAIGAKWRGTDDTALLTALFAQLPSQPEVKVTTGSGTGVQRLEARTENRVIRAFALPRAGMLKEGEVTARAQFLVTGREVRNGKVGGIQWVYVWGAEQVRVPGLDSGLTSGLHRGLLLRDGKGWRIQAKAEGT